MSTTTPQTKEQALASKERFRFRLTLLAIVVSTTLAVAMLSWMGFIKPVSAADLSNGCFKIKATGSSEEFTGIAGSENCGEAPPAPVIPTPDYTAAGICAAPGSDRAIYAIGTGGITEYAVDEDGTIAATGKSYTIPTSTGNALGLTRSGEFYYSSSGRLYGGQPEAIASKWLTSNTYVAGEALVYQGVSEYYHGRYTGDALEISRYSPTAGRTGVVARVETNIYGNNGDFGFDRNGDLRFLVSGGSTAAIGLVKFSDFADLTGNAVPTLSSTMVREWTLGGPAANGIAYLPGDLVAISSTAGIQIVNSLNGDVVSTLAATGVADLANCR